MVHDSKRQPRATHKAQGPPNRRASHHDPLDQPIGGPVQGISTLQLACQRPLDRTRKALTRL